MLEGRLPLTTTRRKPTVILDNQLFPFIDDLKVGNKEQLSAIMTVMSERLRMDEDGVERKLITFRIIKANLLPKKKGERI